MREALPGSTLPIVSIVVPVYNGADTIAECIESFQALAYPRERFEIVIVDNGSTDGTLDVLRRYGHEIRVFQEPTRGPGAARNHGIREARGDIVAFTDADGVADPGWIAALVEALRDPAVGIAAGPVLSRRPCNRIERFGESIHDQRAAVEQRVPYAASGNWGSPRTLLLDVGLFDESLLRCQDVDLSWRISLAGYRLVYTPDARVFHRNERTLWGLFHEGVVHGFHGVRVKDKYAALGTPQGQGRRTQVRRRLAHDLRQLARGPKRVDSALRLLFDLGKSTGEVWAALKTPRRSRIVSPAPSTAPKQLDAGTR